MSCIFCDIIRGATSATIVRQWTDAIAIVPLNPVTDEHLLVIPTMHIWDVSESPYIAGQAMARAAELAKPPFNIITSAGKEATQTVFHLHIHVVPRRENDGLMLPWS
jgi:histidine triad (HIT) family protein